MSPSSLSQDGMYYQKTEDHGHYATSPPLLSSNSGKLNTMNVQIRSKESQGTRPIYGSPGDLSESLQSPRHIGSDGISYLDNPSDDFSSSAQDSPATMNLVLGSPCVARRAKAHVPSACVNCKRKHLACETQRPCNRCLQAGKEVSFLAFQHLANLTVQKATCVDVQHKKRGRPRLRDEDSGRGTNYGPDYTHPPIYPAQPGLSSQDALPPSQYRTASYRELRSQPDLIYGSAQLCTTNSGYPNFDHLGHFTEPQGPQAIRYLPEVNPTALLTLDFVISRSNAAFTNALALRTHVEGKLLKDLVIPSEKEKIQRLLNRLKAEMQESAKSPSYRPPVSEPGPMSREELEMFEATAGFTPRSEYWTFRLPQGQSQGFPMSISLAKTDTYFVVLTLVSGTKSSLPLPSPASQGNWMSSALAPLTSDGVMRYESFLVERSRQNELSSVSLPYHSRTTKSITNSLDHTGRLSQTAHLDLSQYQQNSPNQTLDSGASHSGGSTGTRSSLQESDVPRENLRHLRLPPILTSSIEDSPSSSKTQTRKPSPVKGSPQSAKRKKRQRVDIGEMLR
ncbi:MAG: hypothetical protein MMC33_001210 [Icmadophila ericetorum]|nr:hypothetical protein [Icmadophila ericetorum]